VVVHRLLDEFSFKEIDEQALYGESFLEETRKVSSVRSVIAALR
jgi:hypothetical protein